MENAKVHLTIVINYAAKEEVVNLVGSEFIFGRSSNSTVFINDPSFSRSHFKIMQQLDTLIITDMGSSNGTFVNGIKILRTDNALLNEKDLITVNDSAIKIRIEKVTFEDSVDDLEDKTKILGSQDFSQQLFEVASSKINELMKGAQENAALLISNAHDQIAEERKLMITKTTKDIENYTLEKKAVLLEKFEIEKQAKEKELNDYYEKENERQKAILLSELKCFQEEINVKNSEFKKLHDNVEDEIKKINSAYEKNISAKKEEFLNLERTLEDKKTKLIQQIDAQAESRKLELENDINSLETKFESSNNEFQALFKKYDQKKNEHSQAIDDLSKIKLKTLEEIKNIENDLLLKKQEVQERIARDNSLVAVISHDLDKLKNQKNELESICTKKQSELDLLLGQRQEAKKTLELEEELLRNNKIQLLKINDELRKITADRTSAHSEMVTLSNELNELKKNIQSMNHHAEALKDENNKKIENLKNEFLQNKTRLQADMRKIQEAEEKRLQDFTHQELSQINKIKEDSLRIVLDLEDSITKEIIYSSSKVFANKIGLDKFREVATEYEKSIRISLQKGVLKLLKSELTPDLSVTNKSFFQKKKKMIKPFSYGAVSSAVACGVLFFFFIQFKYQNDPIRRQLEAQAREAAIIPLRTFSPEKTNKLGKDFVSSVIYTEGFYEVYAQENFRSDLMKKGSVYLYKKWQINEEKSIQSFAMMFSLVDTLKLKAEKINPDFEKKDIEKMSIIEKETMKKLEEILGNEVRLEATLKFQTRFYQDYIIQGNKDSERTELKQEVKAEAVLGTPEYFPGE